MTQVSESQTRQTALFNPANRSSEQPEPIRPPLAFSSTAIPWRLLLDISESGSALRVEVANPIIIGRSDLMDGHIPGLDMGPYGGQDYGVSRKHAVLYVDQGNLFIRDLASTNGTRVNGYALEPDQPQKLNEGDEIELGQLRVTLSILHTPA